MLTKHVWLILFVFVESEANLIQYKYMNGLHSNLEPFAPPLTFTQKSEYNPRRSSNYAPGSGSNPTIVAIPLYLRNSASSKSSPLMDALSSSANDGSLSKKVEGSMGSPTMIKPQYSGLRAEPKHHHSHQRMQYSTRDAQPHFENKFSASQYKHVVKPSDGGSYVDPATLSLLAAGGYSAASPTTHLNYAANYGAHRPSSVIGTTARNPGLKVADYDGVQKSAFSDFTSALEGFDVKSISNQDLYNLPGLNAQTITGQAYSNKGASSVKSHGYPDSGSFKNPSQSYGSASNNYEVSFQNYPSPNYVNQESNYYGQRNVGASTQVTSDKGDSTSSLSNDGYNSPSVQEGYSNSGYANGANSGEMKEYGNVYPNGQYTSNQASSEISYSPAANNKAVTGDVSGSYSPSNSVYTTAYNPSTSYSGVVPYESNFGSSYNSGSSQSYSASSPIAQNYPNTQYTGKSSSHQSNQGEYYDHECPEKQSPVSDYTASSTSIVSNSKPNTHPTSNYGINNKATLSGSATSSTYSKTSQQSTSGATQGFDADDIDPSKLDLKIVHLPVSVLRKLVGNGEVALPSYQ